VANAGEVSDASTIGSNQVVIRVTQSQTGDGPPQVPRPPTKLPTLTLNADPQRARQDQNVRFTVTGSVATKGITLLERKLTKLDLPGSIKLKHGLSLAPQNEG